MGVNDIAMILLIWLLFITFCFVFIVQQLYLLATHCSKSDTTGCCFSPLVSGAMGPKVLAVFLMLLMVQTSMACQN